MSWDDELYKKYKVDFLPESTVGEYSINKFTVSKEDESMEKLRAFINKTGRYVPAGKYTRLYYKGSYGHDTIMSDTPDEIRDHLSAIHMSEKAETVLINGLGLGVVLNAILKYTKVKKVTVVELSSDVIELVGGIYKSMYGDRLEIINDSALTFKPPKGAKYDIVWHDIWNALCSDNLTAMKFLHRRYGKRCKWQGSWGREFCERYNR